MMINSLTIALMVTQALSTASHGPFLDEPSRRSAEKRCESYANEEEIVVCAEVDHPTNQRLNELHPVPDAEIIPRAELKVGDAKAGLSAEAANVGGFTSNRLMLGIKIPFGRKAQED